MPFQFSIFDPQPGDRLCLQREKVALIVTGRTKGGAIEYDEFAILPDSNMTPTKRICSVDTWRYYMRHGFKTKGNDNAK